MDKYFSDRAIDIWQIECACVGVPVQSVLSICVLGKRKLYGIMTLKLNLWLKLLSI